MAISAPGIGSGLDINTIMKGLMAAEQVPITRLESQRTTVSTQLTALGKIKSSLATFQTASEALSKPGSLFSFAGTISDASVGKVTVGPGAIAGNYSLEVSQLATNHKVNLGDIGGATTGSAGSLTISVGGTSSASIEIAAGSSLADVRDAINGSKSGVSATIINGKLVATSQESGEANEISITATGGVGSLAFDPANPGGKEIVAAQDAKLTLDGIAMTSASNVVKDAASGVTLTLTKTTTSPVTLSVTTDMEALNKKMTDFVAAYNNMRSTLNEVSKFDPTGDAHGPLNGDSTVSSVLNDMRSVLSQNLGSGSEFPTLVSLGIQSKADGTLEFKPDVLKAAVEKNPSGVEASLTTFGKTFSDKATALNSDTSSVANRVAGLKSKDTSLESSIASMTRQMDQVEARYRKQFSSLDVLMAKYQQTSSYLTSQLASLSK